MSLAAMESASNHHTDHLKAFILAFDGEGAGRGLEQIGLVRINEENTTDFEYRY